MLNQFLFASLPAVVAGWFAGRLHLRANQMKKANEALNLKPGTLESELNHNSETLIAAGAASLQSKIETGK